MGVDVNENARRRENRKKDDEVLMPEALKPTQEQRINELMPNSMQKDGSINIDGAMHDLEKLMRGADKGKFLGMGKDGELDGNEMKAYLKNLEAKGFGIPDSAKGMFDALTRDPDFKINIQETVDIARKVATQFDRNNDGAVSPTEMQAAIQQMSKSQNTER